MVADKQKQKWSGCKQQNEIKIVYKLSHNSVMVIMATEWRSPSYDGIQNSE